MTSVEERATPPTSTPWVPVYGGLGLVYRGDWAAGTYQDGDIAVKDGIAYLCVGGPTVVAPDPAPWGAARPTKESELAYAETTGSLAVTATTPAAAQTFLTAPAVALDGQTTILVEAFIPNVATPASAAAQIVLTLWDGATEIGNFGQEATPAAASMGAPFRLARRLTPSAGAHVFTVRAFVTSGTGNLYCGAGGASGVIVPAFIRVSAVSDRIPIIPGASLPVSYGTTLPVAPVDGQEAILVDSLTAPTYQWRFRWNAGATGPYKWEFIGGAPASSAVAGFEGITGTAITDPATVGPRFTVPRAGDYEIVGAATVSKVSATEVNAQMQVTRMDNLAGVLQVIGSCPLSNSYTGLSGAAVYPGIPAATELRMRYYQSTAGTLNCGARTLLVRPTRVA